MKIRSKFILFPFFIVFSLIFLGYINFLSINNIHNSFDSINKGTIPLVSLIKDMKIGVFRVLSSTMEFALIRCEESSEGEGAEKNEEELIAEGEILFLEAFDDYKHLIKEYSSDQPVFEYIIQNKWEKFIKISDKIIEHKKDGVVGSDISELKEYFEEAELDLLNTLDEILVKELSEAEKREIFVSKTVENSILIIFTIVFLLVSFLLFVSFVMSRSMLKPLERIEDVSREMSEGNFHVRSDIRTNDEFGELSSVFDSMIGDIKKKFELEKYSKKLEEELKERNKELNEKNKELERTLEDFYTLRISMQEKLELEKIKNENKEIKKRLDKMRLQKK